MAFDLPCDGDGTCMKCKAAPPEGEVVHCRTCATPWHVQCLSKPPETMTSVVDWECPDCSPPESGAAEDGSGASAPSGANATLIASIRAIEADASLTEQEKARRRQELMSDGAAPDDDEDDKKKAKGGGDVLDLLGEKFNCAFCRLLPDRPVTTPCGHNFCLKCFQKWTGQGNRTCVTCRGSLPLSHPRINSALVVAIRMAKAAKTAMSDVPKQVYQFIRNENRPEKAFTTERAKKPGKANASSGQIFVTVPPDHFGPILAANDPKRNQGVLVGESWEDRMECRQWGAHLPHVAGIAGQSDHGAQSVALSGGYEDDEDHGEWFLYTGSGGRDLSGNKRTNKAQSFDQKFEKLNEALRVSCKKGYPVRVVRSHKEKRSSYAPDSGVRYDGIYRIEKCWRKVGIQGYKVCRYLFVRCDNEPAPWTSDEQGDRPRPLPVIKELKKASDITVRKESPAWDYDEQYGWRWMIPEPASRKSFISGDPGEGKKQKATRKTKILSMNQQLLKEFSCLICRNVMSNPLTTPCAHNFCKSCLLGSFSNQSFVRERNREGGRKLRDQKIIKKCPSCPNDISDFLQKPEVNREMMDLIETLQKKSEEENNAEASGEGCDTQERASDVEGLEVDTLDEDSGKLCDIESTEKVGDRVISKKVNEEGSDTQERSSGMEDLEVNMMDEDGVGKLCDKKSTEMVGDGVESEKVNAKEIFGSKKDESPNKNSYGEQDNQNPVVALEMEEGGDKDDQTIAAVNSLASHKRKKVVIGRKSGKKAKKSKEVATEDKTEYTSGAEG